MRQFMLGLNKANQKPIIELKTCYDCSALLNNKDISNIIYLIVYA